jgi:FSR family fosmidomycin resistance protein-like MFS transporter
MLFIHLAGVAVGTFVGGPIGDRIGRRAVIWVSILGALPFALLLPHVGLWSTAVLSFVVGMIMASAFSAMVVFAQELSPGRVGTVAGLFFGLAFGIGGIGAALLGVLIDAWGIQRVFVLVSFLPALGMLAALLPRLPR